MSEPEGIVLDHSTWDEQELLLHIIQRYFDLGNEALAGHAWEARAKTGRSDSEALIDLNTEFEPLGYLAMLDEGNPPILSMAHHPEDQPIIPNWQMSLVWVMMAGFLTLIGSAWLQQYHPDAMALDSDLLRESVLYMALPMILALGLASETRRRMAAYFGVDIGHVVPLAFPIMSPSWPFGLAGVLSQRRPDLLPIPNRRAQISLDHPQSGRFTVEIQIQRCRFHRLGWYESTARLVRAVEFMLPTKDIPAYEEAVLAGHD